MRYRSIRFLILFLAFSFTAMGQVSNSSYSTRSKKLMRSNYQKNMGIDALLDSADLYLRKDRNKCFDFLEDAYISSIDKRNYNEQYRVLIKLGEYYEYYKQPDLAALNYENALKEMGSRMDNYSVVLAAGKQYLAADYPLRSMAIYKDFTSKFTDYQNVALFDAIGDVYLSQQKNDSALIFYRKSETLSEKLKMINENLAVKLKIAKILAAEDSPMEYEILNQTNKQSKASNNQKMVIESEAQLADYYKKNSLIDEEINSRNNIIINLEKTKTEAVSNETEVDSRILQEHISLAKIYADQGSYKESLKILQKIFSQKYTENDENLVLLKEAAKLRAQLYQANNEEQKALKSYMEYSEILDKLYQSAELQKDSSALLSNQLRDHQWRIDFLEKDKTIYDAEKEMAEQDRELQTQKINYQRWSIFSMSVVIALLMALLILLISKYRIQQKHNAFLALKSLRIQMNPHFIFNALNSINNFIVKNDELNANKYLARFSKLMRSILNNSEQDFIPLEKEIEILELYLQIEHMRFPDKFDYQLTIDENVNIEAFSIPPMIIQPYIENAVWHGLRYLETDGKLRVDMTMEEDLLKVVIEDNGIGRTKSMELKTKNQRDTESKGIKNTQGRLEILAKIYKKQIRQKITDLYKNGQGTKVEIYIPNLNN